MFGPSNGSQSRITPTCLRLVPSLLIFLRASVDSAFVEALMTFYVAFFITLSYGLAIVNKMLLSTSVIANTANNIICFFLISTDNMRQNPVDI